MNIVYTYGLLSQIPVGQEEDATPEEAKNSSQDSRIDLQEEQIERNSQRMEDYETAQPRAVEIVPTNPIPVIPSTDPIQYLNYGIQGIIFLFVITFGKPLIDQVSLLFSERARIKASKEDKVLDVQMSSSKQILDSQADTREFLQNMVQQQQERLTGDVLLERETQAKRMEIVYSKLDEQLRVMRNTNLIIREIAALLNYDHRVKTGQVNLKVPDLYQEEKDLELKTTDTVTITNPLNIPPDHPST